MDLVPYIVAGLVTGSVYALAATGLVLTYKTSGVFNFAHGATATVAAYAFFSLYTERDVAWPIAAAICVLVVGPLMGLAYELLARSLVEATLVHKVAATVGVMILVQATISIVYPVKAQRAVLQFLPSNSWEIAGTPVRAYQVIVVGIALAATVGLAVFFRVSRTGVAMRAVVDNADLLDLAGTNPVSVRRWAWMIGSSFAAASGVLLSPLLAKLNAIDLTFLVITAFGAAAIGAFTSIPLTYLGGLAIGIGQALTAKWFTEGFLVGLSPSLPFIVLFLVLLVSPKSRLVEFSLPPRQVVQLRQPPSAVQLAVGAGLVVFLYFVPNIFAFEIIGWTTALTYFMVFSSLGLLVRTSGQVSLAHVSFMVIGACAFSHLTIDQGMGWWTALLLSGLIAVPIGAILAIPAIRMSGLYLALATFGFGILLQYMFYGQDFMFGSLGVPLSAPRPDMVRFQDDAGFFRLVLGIAVLTAVVLTVVTRSRLGRLLRGLTDSPTGMSAAGAAVNVTRVLVFCLSAFVAALAGALQGANTTVVSSLDFQPFLSVILFAMVVVSIGSEPWYAVWATGVVFVIPILPLVIVESPNTSNVISICIGLAATFVGHRPAISARLARIVGERRSAGVKNLPGPEEIPARHIPQGAEGIKVASLRVEFGGVVAVNGATLAAPLGRITGLIGPNGAGKTTTFNSCSGLVVPTSGTVHLDGHNLSHVNPSARARRGLGRTFQLMELFDSMSVRENVELGVEAGYAGYNPLTHVLGSRQQRRGVRAAADEAIQMCGLGDIADRQVGVLSTGQRRLVELARVLAGPFHILLLDEPSSGLDRTETEDFGRVLKRVVEEREIGILIVEHDMSLVTSICDYIYVLDFGQPVFEGTPAEVMAAPVVQAAYLGTISEAPSDDGGVRPLAAATGVDHQGGER